MSVSKVERLGLESLKKLNVSVSSWRYNISVSGLYVLWTFMQCIRLTDLTRKKQFVKWHTHQLVFLNCDTAVSIGFLERLGLGLWENVMSQSRLGLWLNVLWTSLHQTIEKKQWPWFLLCRIHFQTKWINTDLASFLTPKRSWWAIFFIFIDACLRSSFSAEKPIPTCVRLITQHAPHKMVINASRPYGLHAQNTWYN